MKKMMLSWFSIMMFGMFLTACGPEGDGNGTTLTDAQKVIGDWYVSEENYTNGESTNYTLDSSPIRIHISQPQSILETRDSTNVNYFTNTYVLDAQNKLMVEDGVWIMYIPITEEVVYTNVVTNHSVNRYEFLDDNTVRFSRTNVSEGSTSNTVITKY